MITNYWYAWVSSAQGGKRVVRSIRCTECRGKGILATLPDFTITMHENIVDDYSIGQAS